MPFESINFDYKLPKESINQNPYKNPNNSKLLIADTKEIIKFKEFNKIINSPSLFIMNKSTVRNVRIQSKKKTEGTIEIFILQILGNNIAKCLIRSTDRKVLNKKYELENFEFKIIKIENNTFHIHTNLAINEIIDKYGKTPLPPYIEDNSKKYKYYNNQFSSGGFSVASPTAGLHFTNKQIKILKKLGHDFVYINLDVNVDTFKPVTSKFLEDHDIHEEYYNIDESDLNKILKAKNKNINIYCIGTTSLRAVESAYLSGNLNGRTDYFIFPDTKINIPDYLITNFHAPKSSLLSIVANVYGAGWPKLYQYALNSGLKFLSFGDAVIFKVNE
jgi:S-adenosylmethionine:tRNA ribosyltransferase-isomerase